LSEQCISQDHVEELFRQFPTHSSTYTELGLHIGMSLQKIRSYSNIDLKTPAVRIVMRYFRSATSKWVLTVADPGIEASDKSTKAGGVRLQCLRTVNVSAIGFLDVLDGPQSYSHDAIKIALGALMSLASEKRAATMKTVNLGVYAYVQHCERCVFEVGHPEYYHTSRVLYVTQETGTPSTEPPRAYGR
jgi:hypothetical protein